MDRSPKPSKGTLALDILRRIFGGRRKSTSKELPEFDQHGLDRSKVCPCDSSPPPTEMWNMKFRRNYDDDDDGVEPVQTYVRSPSRRLQREMSTGSSSSGSKRSSTSECSSKSDFGRSRRRGFYCMRLKILNMGRLDAILRKVRVLHRRLLAAAAASQRIVSLADFYNSIAELIPGSNKEPVKPTTSLIVVIRPISSLSPSIAEERARLEKRSVWPSNRREGLQSDFESRESSFRKTMKTECSWRQFQLPIARALASVASSRPLQF